MRSKTIRWVAVLAALCTVSTVLGGCTSVITGRGTNGTGATAPNAHLPVIGTNGGAFDQTVQNALSDVEGFWRAQFPTISGGAALPPLTGKLYSVDGDDVTPQDRTNACLRRSPNSIVDNAFYCNLDDSIAWDRDPQHLVPVLGAHYSSLLTAAVFAHEFGHAIQNRLHLFDRQIPTIYTESQADCAAGAFLGAVLKGQTPHFRATNAEIDSVLLGYLDVRDPPPASVQDIDHGNGFDRLTAVADGIDHGVSYCYGSTYFTRKFTERPYSSPTDQSNAGNESFEQVVDPDPPTATGGGGGGLQPDLNRFWTAQAKTINKDWNDVKTTQADTPPCAGGGPAKFAYCPDQNSAYYQTDYARSAYNSLPSITIDQGTGNVTVVNNAPADFALGTLFVYAWGFAVRHQLFGGSINDQAALLAASCYAGAYSASINVNATQTDQFTLSPPDMDEALSAVIQLVPQTQAFGARGTTALQRIQAFDKGYFNGLSSC